MNPRNQFRFPWVDASILLAMLLIGWAAFRLANLEPQIAGDGQLSRELRGIFKECQDLFKDSIGDAQQLKQVLINLIQNAARSIGRDGHITLRARDGSATLKGTETRVAIIEVEDDGPGIRPEVQGRLFYSFFSTRKGGTGLGLTISARIIDRHGGRLDFETQVSQGTVFRITLPAYEEE